MKIILEPDNQSRSTKCYIIHDDGSIEYIDFWDIKIDCKGKETRLRSWPHKHNRAKSYRLINDIRELFLSSQILTQDEIENLMDGRK